MTTEQRTAVIEKIKKCLALAGSPNENEARVAASKRGRMLSAGRDGFGGDWANNPFYAGKAAAK